MINEKNLFVNINQVIANDTFKNQKIHTKRIISFFRIISVNECLADKLYTKKYICQGATNKSPCNKFDGY